MYWWLPFIISVVAIVITGVILKLTGTYLYASITMATIVGAIILLIMRPYKVSECVYDPQPGDMVGTIVATIIGINVIVFLAVTVLRSNSRGKMCACCLRDREFYSPGFFNDIEDLHSDSSARI